MPVYSPPCIARYRTHSSLTTEGGLRLSRPGWLVLCRSGLSVQRRSTSLTRPSIDRVQHVTTTLDRTLSQLRVLHLPVKLFTAHNGARYWLRIDIFVYPTCIRHSAKWVPVGILIKTFDMEKLWHGKTRVWLPDAEKILKHKCDARTETDGQTLHESIGCTYT